MSNIWLKTNIKSKMVALTIFPTLDTESTQKKSLDVQKIIVRCLLSKGEFSKGFPYSAPATKGSRKQNGGNDMSAAEQLFKHVKHPN